MNFNLYDSMMFITTNLGSSIFIMNDFNQCFLFYQYFPLIDLYIFFTSLIKQLYAAFILNTNLSVI